MDTTLKVFIGFVIFVIIGLTVANMTPGGRAAINKYIFNVQKADDATRYSTLRQVENTARAMVASYKADISTYNQLKYSKSEEQQGWAMQAKMRANKTAASFNEYILKNSFVWQGNVPYDIATPLPMVD